jgi:hypothetical protein
MAKRYFEEDRMLSGAGKNQAGSPDSVIMKSYPSMPPASYDRPYDSIEGGIDQQINADKKYKPARTKY